ncbi:hypothetical protein [Lacticaseibacillus absianus]|uniref:hypothetical protein n=1 Tax=Lacticaseibacillus absianus TaxID=2729623 RepID=UPI0015CC4EF2|nr:hypothetical protein [Lacticaseibacillus absianus]
MTKDNDEAALERALERLTAGDRRWFAQVTLYMRLCGWVRDTAAVTGQLTAMAQDLADAERGGQDATAYFGNSPRQMAQEILSQLPLIGWPVRLKLFVGLAGFSWLLLLLAAASTGAEMQLSAFQLLVLLGCLGLGEAGVMRSFAEMAYAQTLWRPLLGFAVSVVLCGGAAGLTLRWAPAWAAVTVPTPWDYWVIGVSVLAIVIGLTQLAGVRLRRLLDPNVGLIVLLLGAALLRRYWLNTGTEMTQGQAIWILAGFGGGTLAYIGWQLLNVVRAHRLSHE